MQVTKNNLTIIIVTIKSHKVIDACLKSISPKIKKIVIENSTDQSFKNYLKKKYKNLECFITKKNLGMGVANNFGIKKSKTRYVMILNPDTRLRKNTLEKIYKISKNLNFSILSPLSDNRKYPNYKNKKNSKNKIKDIGLIDVEQVDGYAMLLDKNKFQNKFFDENIFMYLENDDLCIRTKKMKNKIFIYTKSLIYHLGAKAVDQKYKKELELSRNWHWNWSKFYFRKKHYGFISAFNNGILVFIKSIIKSFYYLLILKNFKSKTYFFRASGFVNALLGRKSWYRPKLD